MVGESYVELNGVRQWVRVVGDLRGLPRIVLLGISFGGDLAAEYTVVYPDRVAGLILQGTALAAEPPRRVPLVDELAALEVRVLVLVGFWDRNAGVDACRDLATRLPQAQLHVFGESAHFPNVEEPDRYLAEIAAFTGG